MGRFHMDDADNYGKGSGNSYFSLADDGDTARVRFMYNGMEDVTGYAVHEITMPDGKRRYVNCLRAYNEPKSKCPFCEAEKAQRVKVYVPLYVYDKDEGEVKLWERGKTFFSKLSSLCAHFTRSGEQLVSHIFEIERHGRKGDTGTRYEIYEEGHDDVTLADLPEVPDVIGTVILDKSADEMRAFLATGSFDSDNGNDTRASEPVGRRTPGGRREVF